MSRTHLMCESMRGGISFCSGTDPQKACSHLRKWRLVLRSSCLFPRWKGTCGLNQACSIEHESRTRMKQHLKLLYPHCTIQKVYCHPRSAEQKPGHLFVFGFYLELIDSHWEFPTLPHTSSHAETCMPQNLVTNCIPTVANCEMRFWGGMPVEYVSLGYGVNQYFLKQFSNQRNY